MNDEINEGEISADLAEYLPYADKPADIRAMSNETLLQLYDQLHNPNVRAVKWIGRLEGEIWRRRLRRPS